jgi:bacterioferritin (cytochrome b1)
MPGVTRGAPLDRLMRPIHQWVWADTDRRLRKLLTFADVETDGGRDILRAAEVTADPLLRRLYLEHAIDELHHGDLFRERGEALSRARRGARRVLLTGNPLPGGHGLDDLRIEGQPDRTLLAFLHVAEKSAAGRFAIYRELVDDDPQTRMIFEEILRDEVFHMNYTYTQLTRIAPERYRRHVWHARAKRLWNRYLRVAAALAAVFGNVLLAVMYFILLPPFAWFAKRSERREPIGWIPVPRARQDAPPRSQY